jgi:methenyltetrahydromethanopterin cyclohydrolase
MECLAHRPIRLLSLLLASCSSRQSDMNQIELMLNREALAICNRLADEAGVMRVSVEQMPSGCRVMDFGVRSPGGLRAGQLLAEICLSGLGAVSFLDNKPKLSGGVAVQVATDHPVAACMASQYAGWQIAGEKFFAMGSGPMRALAAREPLFQSLDLVERSNVAVGVLETGKLPPDEVCSEIAAKCGVEPPNLTLCVARTASLAGTVQIVARSVETALHKLHELGFPLAEVQSGYGVAPLPPVAKDDLAAIGRTNDAILYGGEVTLWVRCDDAAILEIGPRVPSSASADHGRPFGEIFARYSGDFYKIDPLLFSPAVVTFNNLSTGRTFRFGRLEPDVLAESFAIEAVHQANKG